MGELEKVRPHSSMRGHRTFLFKKKISLTRISFSLQEGNKALYFTKKGNWLELTAGKVTEVKIFL